MDKHTPGPWNLQNDGLGVYYVNPRIEAGEDIEDTRHDSIVARCTDFGAFSGIEDDEAAANARLIAAAPELLAALENLVNTLDEDRWTNARAAIRAAKGE
jgi:hypothetical protein